MRKYTIILLLFMVSLCALAQPNKTTETVIIDNHLFYAHKVVKGQTLYRLSILYNVHIDTIIRYNSQAEKGLSIDEIIHIPLTDKIVSSYIIKQGDTWSSIAKTRNISEKELLLLNPSKSSTQILNVGQSINVPILQNDNSIITSSISSKKDKNKPNSTIVVEKNQTLVHTVSQGETLYGIANKYGTKVDVLKKINPGLTENISVGQRITIPEVKGTVQINEQTKIQDVDIVQENKRNSAISVKTKIGQKKNKYLVYMFIPLYLSKGTDFDINEVKTLDEYKHIKQFSFIQFYEALLLAAEDVEKQYPNIQIELRIEDVSDLSSAKMTQLMNSGALQNADLIIGPFFGKEFSALCQYAKHYDICLINPFSVTFEDCGSFVYKAMASYYNQGTKLAQYINNKHSNANIIIVNNQSQKENAMAKDYISAMKNVFAGKSFSIKEINFQSSGITGVKSAINSSCENYIITFFNGEITITNFVQSLHASGYENVTLVAPESWLNFDNIETEYFMELKTHYISQYYVDYSQEKVIRFLDRFREKYQIEPTLKLFAFQGYDITYYFLSSLCEKGTAFSECDIPNTKLLSTKYEFSPLNVHTLENTFVNIFKIKDYKYIDALTDIENIMPSTNKKR